jgi:SAM-dependent methyltransferase
MFWFDKFNKNTVYGDVRQVEDEILWEGDGYTRKISVIPNAVMDFKNLPFKSSSFGLVVFDPPHLTHGGDKAWIIRKYGKLTKNWRVDLSRGFNECWRVLKPGGTLILKWCEIDIKLSELLAHLKIKPILGHTTNIKMNTHWLLFYKGD